MEDINKYENISREILKRLGKVKEYEGSDYYGADDYNSLEYEFDGLKISSINYYDKVKKMNGIYLINNPHDITIKYNYQEVFNNKTNTINHGSWEELLLEIYKTIDVLEEEIVSSKKIQVEGKEYYEKIRYKFPYVRETERGFSKNTGKAKREIKELNIFLITELLEYEHSDECGYDQYYDYYIYKDDNENCVFHAKKEPFEEIKIKVFKSGDWREELIKHFELEEFMKKMMAKKTEDDSIQSSIRKLQLKRK